MPFDAVFLSAVTAELRASLIGSRVDKVQMPSRDLVVLLVGMEEGIFPHARTLRD